MVRADKYNLLVPFGHYPPWLMTIWVRRETLKRKARTTGVN